jgi:hypothetical protein
MSLVKLNMSIQSGAPWGINLRWWNSHKISSFKEVSTKMFPPKKKKTIVLGTSFFLFFDRGKFSLPSASNTIFHFKLGMRRIRPSSTNVFFFLGWGAFTGATKFSHFFIFEFKQNFLDFFTKNRLRKYLFELAFVQHFWEWTNVPISTHNSLIPMKLHPGNTKGGSITVPLTSCLTGFD